MITYNNFWWRRANTSAEIWCFQQRHTNRRQQIATRGLALATSEFQSNFFLIIFQHQKMTLKLIYRFYTETMEQINNVLRRNVSTGTSCVRTATKTSHTAVNHANSHLATNARTYVSECRCSFAKESRLDATFAPYYTSRRHRVQVQGEEISSN